MKNWLHFPTIVHLKPTNKKLNPDRLFRCVHFSWNWRRARRRQIKISFHVLFCVSIIFKSRTLNRKGITPRIETHLQKTGEIVERRWFSALMQTVFSHSESPAKHTFQTRGHPVAWHSRRESTIIFDFRCSSCCAARHGTISNSDKRHAGRNKVTKIKQKCAPPPPSQQMNEKKNSFFF